ncbi:MAG: Sensor histidine kinase RcsC [Phycisphaerae bacterium]|nr:Sensor histidine kinase RcsC [Phycisphaerae bacterium]
MVILVVGVGISLSVFGKIRDGEEQRLSDHLGREAHERIEAIVADAENDLVSLRGLVAFFSSSQKVEPEEFREFVKPFLDWRPDIQAMLWIPRERTPDGHDAFVPRYVEPGDAAERLPRTDLSADPVAWAAMQRACDTGCPIMTAPLGVRVLGSEAQMLTMAPVYAAAADHDTAESRRRNLAGFVARAFSIDECVRQSLAMLAPSGIDVHLFDLTDGGAPVRLWEEASPSDPTGRDHTQLKAEAIAAETVEVAGRQWEVLCVPNDEKPAVATSWHPWAILAAMLLATVTLAAYLGASRRSAVKTQRLAARLSAMISDMEEGVVFADADGVVTDVKGYFCRFVGRPPDGVIGWKITDFHSGPIQQRIADQLEAFRRNIGSPPLILQRAIGQAEVILRVQPVYRRGRYDGVLLNVVDVTELVTARRQAESANAAKGSFVANVSHEIRTPMTAILGYADLVAESIECCDRCPDHVTCRIRADNVQNMRIVQRNGNHLLSLINDLLDLSKIEAGKLSVSLEPCSIVTVLADVASMMRPRAEQQGTSLSLQFDGPLPATIRTDPSRLRQVLVNVVGNAVKFTAGGKVAVRTRMESEGERAGCIRIEIRDSGIGMTDEQVAGLFRPFTQADATTSRRFGGTGLGLAISQRLMDLLGGRIDVQSDPGRGSTFVLILPAGDLTGVPMLHRQGEALQCDRSRPPAVGASCPALHGLRVLLAEDGLDNKRLVSLLLTRAGAEVETAANGREAVRMATHSPYDVILMDMQMPEVDGCQATRMLRRGGYSGPILALTANAMSSDREQCLAAGCDDHLAKPIHQTDLIAAVARWGRPAETYEESRADACAVPAAAPATLISEMSGDPALAVVLAEFVGGLGAGVEAMRTALEGGCHGEVKRLAHQLKGAGGSYGYPMLTECARALEQAAAAGDLEGERMAMARLEALCQAAIRGHSNPTSVRQS